MSIPSHQRWHTRDVVAMGVAAALVVGSAGTGLFVATRPDETSTATAATAQTDTTSTTPDGYGGQAFGQTYGGSAGGDGGLGTGTGTGTGGSTTTTLDSLRAGGRTIGLISHVESMKEQIPAKLQIRVTPQGHSEIDSASLVGS